MNRDQALAAITRLEDRYGKRLADLAVDERDQYLACLRDDLAELMDVTDPGQADAAFAGALLLACALFEGPSTVLQVRITALLLRALAERRTQLEHDKELPEWDL